MMWITLLLALIAVAALGAFIWRAGLNWRSETASLRRQLLSAATPAGLYDPAMLAPLPAPVRRYLELALSPGQPLVKAAELTHSGSFNMGQDQPNWKPFSSSQLSVTSRPGFDWDARIRMAPGLPVFVRDAYVSGRGILTASIFGLIPVAQPESDDELAQGELMRFLAESPWYPTALLPGQGVSWQELSPSSARATLRDGAVSTSVDFHFGPDGLIERIYSPSRTRLNGKTRSQLPWQGRFWNYTSSHGMRIPFAGEVAWLTPAGPAPYWRASLEKAVFTFAR
ncbi:MAG: hypothetical protein K7J46_05345 [Bryobacter sp.]|jgi:hypothetical protein|nr:hypothetical protein [Bryobacter sp. CoA8 C33]